MKNTSVVSKHRIRLLGLLASLIVTLGCATLTDRSFWSGLYGVAHPAANVRLEPSQFCVGETLTATYSDGVQIRNCDPANPDIVTCKRHSLSSYPFSDLFLAGTFPEGVLSGSVSGTADFDTDYTATYRVEWDGWSNFRAYRQEATDGRTWTGIVQAQDTSTPMNGAEYSVLNTYRLECDEATQTWQMARTASYFQESIDGRYYGASTLGSLSACSAITEICYPITAFGRMRFSVEGGPTVILGAPGGPLCTNAFMGYHPDDIRMEPLDYTLPQAIGSPCGGTLTSYDINLSASYSVAASNLCAKRFVGDSFVPAASAGAHSFEYGAIPMVGVSRDRCRASLDPDFLASYDLNYGVIPPGGGGGSPGEPAFTPTPSGSPDQPTPTATTAPIVECGPGWLPALGCSCCGTTLTCADGTIAEFNPACMGGAPPDVCGDGVCSPAEGAVCGTCSIDCGPC